MSGVAFTEAGRMHVGAAGMGGTERKSKQAKIKVLSTTLINRGATHQFRRVLRRRPDLMLLVSEAKTRTEAGAMGGKGEKSC